MIGFKKILQRFRSRRIPDECPKELRTLIEALEKEFLGIGSKRDAKRECANPNPNPQELR
jgi:hypothetical protein